MEYYKNNIGINNEKRENSDVNKNHEDSLSKINAEKFNGYFLKIAENILEKNKSDNSLKENNTTYFPCNLLQFNNTSTGEIKKL
jgi:hypothetical protein